MMTHRVLWLGEWRSDFLFAEDNYDEAVVVRYLEELSPNDNIVEAVLRVVRNNRMNTGFTYSDIKTKRSLVVIGPSSSGEQFINTLVHELYHMAAAIAESLGVRLDGEVPAYIIGDAAESLASLVCFYGCSDIY